jgi:hypothetical protein
MAGQAPDGWHLLCSAVFSSVCWLLCHVYQEIDTGLELTKFMAKTC